MSHRHGRMWRLSDRPVFLCGHNGDANYIRVSLICLIYLDALVGQLVHTGTYVM